MNLVKMSKHRFHPHCCSIDAQRWDTYSCFLHDLTIWVILRVYYKKKELLTLREHPGPPPPSRCFSRVRVVHHFYFVCLRAVSWVPHVANFSWLSLRFSLTCIWYYKNQPLPRIAFIFQSSYVTIELAVYTQTVYSVTVIKVQNH